MSPFCFRTATLPDEDRQFRVREHLDLLVGDPGLRLEEPARESPDGTFLDRVHLALRLLRVELQ